jgi:endonuclease/exonuclease/phosphatase family metal-dependent hydrolase
MRARVKPHPALCFVLVTLATATNGNSSTVTVPSPQSGAFTVLTYNVAGLPIFVSESDPMHNTPRIGTLLNMYDVAVVQEDFAYHDALTAGAKHDHRSPPLIPDAKVGIGDGLNVFSRLPFSDFQRVTWRTCNGRFSNGSDCLAPKGFAFARLTVTAGVDVDLYDLHMDAGHDSADIDARAEQVEQLLSFLEHRSAHHAVIVAGDTNMGDDSEHLLQRLLNRARLTDACRALACSKPHLIDRVMYRGSESIRLQATSFTVDSRFVGADGKPLSDHDAVGVGVEWSTEPRVSERQPTDKHRS